MPIPGPRNLPAPPRSISIFSQAMILFGGFFQQFGWSFFLLGSILSWIFLANSEVIYVFSGTKTWTETTGKVEKSEPTNMSENESLIYLTHYTFIHDYREYVGYSYTLGYSFDPGEEVAVLHNPEHPNASVIKGARRGAFGYSVLFVAIFPLAGLGLIVGAFISNLRYLRLLRDGTIAKGKMIEKTQTNSTVTINNVKYPVYKFVFSFEYLTKPYQAVCKTHQTHTVEDDAYEMVLFDRLNPTVNALYDAIPNAPRIDEFGDLRAPALKKAWVLVLPLLTAVINGLFAWNFLNLG